MKRLNMKMTVLSIALMLMAMLILLTACSEEHAMPLASETMSLASEAEHASLDIQNPYPALTPEMLATGPAPGFRFLSMPNQTALDDNECDSARAERFFDRHHDRNVKIDHFVEIKVRHENMLNDTTIVIVAPSTCYAVADCYPHPYQFNGTIEIKWKVHDMNFPEGFDYSTLIPWYVNDAGEYLPVEYEWRGNYHELIIHTDHFSRYIIGQAIGQ